LTGLWEHPNQAKAIGKAGSAYIQQFKAEQIREQWRKLYVEVLRNFQ